MLPPRNRIFFFAAGAACRSLQEDSEKAFPYGTTRMAST